MPSSTAYAQGHGGHNQRYAGPVDGSAQQVAAQMVGAQNVCGETGPAHHYLDFLAQLGGRDITPWRLPGKFPGSPVAEFHFLDHHLEEQSGRRTRIRGDSCLPGRP